MLRLFSRTAQSTVRSAFRPNPTLSTITKATMSGKAENPQLKNTDLFDVSHITAVVTGGGTGIGVMITQALVTNGAKVYITGRRKEKLDKAIELYSTGPGSIHALPGDVSDKEDVIRLAKEMESKEPNGIHLL
ncbi:hypothetical protein KCU77_g8292, partial [Aureobasidium melanogenum]